MSAIVHAVSRYCEDLCPPGRKCLSCVFAPYLPRVVELLEKKKAKVIRIEEWRKERGRKC